MGLAAMKFAYFFRADFATRDFAISFLTPAIVALPNPLVTPAARHESMMTGMPKTSGAIENRLKRRMVGDTGSSSQGSGENAVAAVPFRAQLPPRFGLCYLTGRLGIASTNVCSILNTFQQS
jgi:hypothetical protein